MTITQRIRHTIENTIWYVQHTKFGKRYATGKLWHALYQSRRSHPIITWAQQSNRRFQITRTRLLILSSIVIAALALYGTMLTGLSFPAMVVGVIAAIPALVLIFNGTVLGTHWAMTIAESIAREYQGGRFELLTVTPHGTLEISWLMAMGVIHRTDRLSKAFRNVRAFIGIVLFALIFTLFMNTVMLIGMDELQRFGQFSPIFSSLSAILVFCALFLDQIQSIVLGALVGIWLPAYVQSPQPVRNLAVGVYLTLQVSFYAAVVGFYVVLQDGLLSITTAYWLPQFILVLLTFAVFFFLREAIIHLIWWLMLRRYHATQQEFLNIIA
jgi:hypothetical protein